MKALLVQQGLHKNLAGKLSKIAIMLDEDWEELDLKATNTIQLCLADEVIYNVIDEETVMGLWSRLEMLYVTKTNNIDIYVMDTDI